jgi:DNA invertase Pin-like site-specific DNA recombinase
MPVPAQEYRMVRKSVPLPLAYSYLRFSSPQQGAGDSIRRQDALRDAWLAKTGVTLDTSLSLRDEGVSAFTGAHRQNPDRHALAAFLKLVRDGRIPRGSYLIVESLDRLSREHIRPALTLLLNLIEAGVRIVQLLPVETVYDEKVEPMALMMAIMELARGRSESLLKSERIGHAWRQKKRAAALAKQPITGRAPAWLTVENGRFRINREKAEAVRRIYRLAADGYGIGAITKKLNAQAVPPLGPAGHWARSYVAKLLTTRTVLGEYQPRQGRGKGRKPDGEPILGFYPAIATEDQWHAARAAMAARRQKGGRPSVRVNLFAGLLKDARDGGGIQQAHKHTRRLASYRANNGLPGTRFVSFPFDVFEQAVLSLLSEIDPRDVLPQEDGEDPGRVLVLTGKLAEIEGRIEKIKARLVDGGDVPALVDVLRALDEKRAGAGLELAEAERQAASPLSRAWGEYRDLLGALDAAPDREEARMRLRSAIRRIVEGIWCLFVESPPTERAGRPRGKKAKSARLAAVQMWFNGGGHRDYLIGYRPSPSGAAWWARSLTGAELKKPGRDFDLRDAEYARMLAERLAAWPLEELEPAAGSRKEPPSRRKEAKRGRRRK